jgi:nitroreductase
MAKHLMSDSGKKWGFVCKQSVSAIHVIDTFFSFLIRFQPEVDVLNLLKSRRSIRIYQDKPVPQDLLLQILEAGRWAPTGANLQPWHFIVVTDPETRKRIGEVARFFFIKSSYVENAPVVLVLGFDTRKGKYGRYDATLAGGNMMTMATSLGLGTCWIGAFDELKVKEILEIPKNIEVISLITLGYSEEKAEAPPRLELEKIAHWESWSNVRRQTLMDGTLRSGPFSLIKKFLKKRGKTPNNKQIPMNKIQNFKLNRFGHRKLQFIWDLRFGIWDLKGD